MARAAARAIGTGQLHTRLVALFSVIAAVPTVIVAIFASLLLQSGLEFWFSDRARGMLENTVQLAQSAYNSEVNRVGAEAVTMGGDLLQDPRARADGKSPVRRISWPIRPISAASMKPRSSAIEANGQLTIVRGRQLL